MKNVLIGLSVFVIMYLSGSFFEVTFDISKWHTGTRALVIALSVIFGGMTYGALEEEERKRNKN